VKALVMPIPKIAKAIEERDSRTLERLKGVGKRTADKIIATLQGKVGKFALMRSDQISGMWRWWTLRNRWRRFWSRISATNE